MAFTAAWEAAPGNGYLEAFCHARPTSEARGRHFNAWRALPISGLQRPGQSLLATSLTTFTDEARIALDTLSGRAAGCSRRRCQARRHRPVPRRQDRVHLRLVHNLIHGGRLPLFEAQKSGRISRAFLEEQPDDAVPRFQYEDHIAALVDERIWPDSTRAISRAPADHRVRIGVRLEPAVLRGKLSVDIVDYPGEWLLDLPLLGKTYAEFSRDAFDLARAARARRAFAGLAAAGRDVDPSRTPTR